MKHATMIFSTVLLSSNLWASSSTPPRKAGHPCAQIVRACKLAGYIKKGPRGRAVKRDCLDPLTRGQAVRGVTNISPSVIKSCKAQKALWYVGH